MFVLYPADRKFNEAGIYSGTYKNSSRKYSRSIIVKLVKLSSATEKLLQEPGILRLKRFKFSTI